MPSAAAPAPSPTSPKQTPSSTDPIPALREISVQPQAALPVAAAPPDATPPDATGSLGRWLRDLPACCHAVLLLAALQLALLAALGVIVLATGDASGAARLCAIALLLTSTWAFALGVAGVVLEHLEVQAAAVALAALAVVVGLLAVPCATPPARRASPPARPPARARPPADRRRPPARRSAPAELALPCWLLAGGAAALLAGGAWPVALTHRRFSWRSLKRVGANRRAAAARAAQLLRRRGALGRRPRRGRPRRRACHPRRRFSPQRRRRRRLRGAPRGEHRLGGRGAPRDEEGVGGDRLRHPRAATRLRARRRRRRAARLRRRRRRRARNGRRRRAARRRMALASIAVCVAVLLVVVVVARGVALYAIVRAAVLDAAADAGPANPPPNPPTLPTPPTPPPTPPRSPGSTRCCSGSVPTRRWRPRCERCAWAAACASRPPTPPSTPRRATRGCSYLTTVPRYDGAGAPRRSVSSCSTPSDGRCPAPTRRPPPRPPTPTRVRSLAAATSPRGSPRRSRTRDWHASLNALGEGAEYSEPEPSPVHRASDVSRSSTVAFESSRPSSAGRYSSKSSTGRYSELSRPSRATELATSGGWETPRPSCSPVLVEEEGPAAADTRGLDERLNESLPPPSQLRRSLSQEVASRPRSRSSIAAAAEEESAVLSPPPQGKVSRTSMAAATLGDPGQRRPRRRGRVDLVRAARLVDALGKGRRRSRL